MPVLTRNTGPRGPRFFEEGGEIMFVHVLDGSTRFGPRPATDEDRTDHPTAWLAYCAEDETFPGAPPVTFADPVGGRPPERTPRRRGVA